MDDLEVFARRHELPILSIADLIAYRIEREILVEEIDHAPLASAALGLSADSGWAVRTFRSRVDPVVYYVAMIKGDIEHGGADAPVLVRAQRAQVLGDVFGFGEDSGRRLRGTLRQIDRAGRGVFLYVIGSTVQDVDRMLGRVEAEEGPKIGLKPAEQGFRQFGLGAQVLKSLGLRRIRVITDNPRKIIGLHGFGIEVAGTTPVEEVP
jgi:3,4-dihydroxy 2-butanone 4-phosphate synthase / GTP cyclohydrolase II